MKSLLVILILVIGCGKNNESGKKPVTFFQDEAYSVDEESIRKTFVRDGQNLLQLYQSRMKEMFGPRTVGLIRNRLKHDHIFTTETLILNRRSGGYVHSYQRNYDVTLYVGTEEPQVSWRRFQKGDRQLYQRWVMHELLLLGNVDDQGFRYTDRILRRR